MPAANSRFAIGGISCSVDSFIVAESLYLRIIFCGGNSRPSQICNTLWDNSTYPKGGVSCSKDSFVVNQTLVFQIKFCGKSPALRVAAKR
jgi:hypothetical protein